MELAQSSLDQNEEDKAIKNLDLLINKFPKDSLASLAQYKLVNIYKTGNMILRWFQMHLIKQ